MLPVPAVSPSLRQKHEIWPYNLLRTHQPASALAGCSAQGPDHIPGQYLVLQVLLLRFQRGGRVRTTDLWL